MALRCIPDNRGGTRDLIADPIEHTSHYAGMGEAFQSSVAACTTARLVKSAFRFIVIASRPISGAPKSCGGYPRLGIQTHKACVAHHLNGAQSSLNEFSSFCGLTPNSRRDEHVFN